MLKKDERSRNVYENKHEYDHLPENKATFLHNFSEILYKCTCILQKPRIILSLVGCCSMNSSRQKMCKLDEGG